MTVIGIGCQGRKLHSTAFPLNERPTIRASSHAPRSCFLMDTPSVNFYAQEPLKRTSC